MGLGVALAREPVDRGPARIAEAEEARALVERLARRVVERRAEDGERAALPDLEQHRVTAAREQADERRLQRVRLEVERGDVALQVVDGHERQAPRPGERLRRGEADEEGADEARPARDGDPVDVLEARRRPPRAPSAAPGRRSRGGAATRSRARRRRSGRAAPPARRRRSRAIRPSSVTRAAAVSSQEVSSPRITRRAVGARVAPHDQRVFAVVRVVPAPDPAALEAQLLVERDRALVRDAHLERVPAPSLAGGQLEQAPEQRRRDALAPVLGRNRDVHHVPRVDVARDDHVAHQLARLRLEGAEADRGRLRELPGEHRAGPRSRVRGALDRLDRRQVAEAEAAEVDARRRLHARTVRSASGTRR